MKSPWLVACEFNHYTAILTLRLIILTAGSLVIVPVKPETLTSACMETLANQGQIAKLKPFKVKPPSKISAFK